MPQPGLPALSGTSANRNGHSSHYAIAGGLPNRNKVKAGYGGQTDGQVLMK